MKEKMLNKLSYWVRLGLALCRTVCPGGISTSCNRDERWHAKANCETTSPRKIILFPSSPLICVCLLQTVSHLRISTLTTSKVKTYSDIGGIIRKFSICTTGCQNIVQQLGIVHFLFIIFFLVLWSSNNIFVILMASSLFFKFLLSPLSISCYGYGNYILYITIKSPSFISVKELWYFSVQKC